ncbi:MAG: phage capsid protein [Burkholderiaceae bacterium]|nr:MAG: phage capsid protein [Burkholderiaceae bacterium]
MPVDVHRVDDIAATAASIYREAETALLRMLARRLATGLDASDWARKKLAETSALRQAAQAIVTALVSTGSRDLRATVAAAYRAGRADAIAELAQHMFPASGLAAPARITEHLVAARARSVQALADAIVRELEPVHSAILPQAMSLYRQAIAGATARHITGAASRRQAAQAAWARLSDKGVTGFTDVRGHRWRLHTYVEMATRTAALRAALTGQVDEFTAHGVRLVSVDDVAGECEMCRPWERKILALTGSAGTVTEVHARDGRPVTVEVAATLTDAMAAGLFHPNCRHTMREYRPGVSRLAAAKPDPEGDAARQRQRYLERGIRAWREREAAALTDAARRVAAAKVRAWDTALGEHTAAHDLQRIRYREQIGAGHVPTRGRVDDLAAELGVPDQATLDGGWAPPPRTPRRRK